MLRLLEKQKFITISQIFCFYQKDIRIQQNSEKSAPNRLFENKNIFISIHAQQYKIELKEL